MRAILAIFYFLLKKNLAFINSPLQFICFVEYIKKFENNFNILFIGYTQNYSVRSIKKVESFYKKKNIKFKVIYLNEILNIHIFHFILNLRKYFFLKLDAVVIGDYRYYLHQKIFSISKKRIFVDDGFGSLYFNKFFSEKIPNSIFFTCYPLNYNVENIIENNFEYLRSLYKFKKKIKGSIFILPGLSEKKIMTRNQYFNWICQIKNLIKGEITLVPHRHEIDFIKNSNYLKKKFNIKINYLPIEISLLKFNYLPRYIFHNYSSCSITLNKILGKKVKILNYNNKYLEKYIDIYNKGKKPNETIFAMKKFLIKNKLKSL